MIDQNDIASDELVDQIMQSRADEVDRLRRMCAGWILYGVAATALIAYLLAVKS